MSARFVENAPGRILDAVRLVEVVYRRRGAARRVLLSSSTLIHRRFLIARSPRAHFREGNRVADEEMAECDFIAD